MQSWKKLRAWFEGHAHGAIAAMATLIGLTLYVYSGIGQNQRATSVFLQDIEQRSLDFRFAVRGSREADSRIVIVDIDEKTLDQIGEFPLPRSTYAQLVRALKQDGARVVAFDMTFPEPESSQALKALKALKSQFVTPGQKKLFEEAWKQADVDAQFADTLQGAGNVVLGHLFLEGERAKYTDPEKIKEYLNIILARPFPEVLKVGAGKFKIGTAWEQGGGSVMQGIEPNLPQFAEAAASFGFFNISPDQDGTLRRALLMCRYRDEDYFPSPGPDGAAAV